MALLLALALFLAPDSPGVVVKPVANMYSAPTEDADVVSQAIFGTNVGILEEQQGWIKVRTPDDYTGWMASAALRQPSPGEQPYASSGRVAQVESLFANLYREPDVTKHQPLLTVPFEAKLEVTEEADDGRWLKVRLPDDRIVWIQRGDIVFDPGPLSIKELIAFSRRFLGQPYTWGGTTTFGYDCSGFTQMLLRRRGIVMPRDADDQAAWPRAVPIKKSQLKPGDLLFFGESAERITHTGLYIGRGKFVHATTHQHPVVQVSKLSDPHWARLLVACRRVP